MSLAHYIQRAWQQQASWLIVLRPLSCVYRGIFLLQKKQKQKHAYRAPVPIMIIGNITVGGSGKTPLIINLVKYLQSHGVQVGVISRGYGGQGHFPALVDQTSTALAVGDEPTLIVQSIGVPMAVGANRQQAIELLLQHHDVSLILSDDGLQHFALQRDIEWVVVDSARGFGNEKLLPEGFLREPLSRLASVTVIEHHLQPASPLNMHLMPKQPFCLFDQYHLDSNNHNVQNFNGHLHYQAVVGIGYPERFFNTLNELNINFTPRIFADHHAYTVEDFQDFKDQPIITTAKDAVKLRELWQDQPECLLNIWVVPVEAVLSQACYDVLDQQLHDLGIHF